MSSRYWIAAIAFGLIVLSASEAVVQEDAQNGENSGNAEQAQQTEQQRPGFVTALEGIESAIRELVDSQSDEQTKAESERSAADLDAQEEMAEWAKEVALAAIASAVFTLGGLILIWRTLHHTKKAAEHTEKMLGEAVATTAAAREANVIERGKMRPWLYFKYFEEIVPPGNMPFPEMTFVSVIENAGDGFAKGVRVCVDYRFVNQGELIIKTFPTDLGQNIAPPRGSAQSKPFVAEGGDLASFFNGNKTILIQGRVNYTDASGEITYWATMGQRAICTGTREDNQGREVPNIIYVPIEDMNDMGQHPTGSPPEEV